MAEVWNKWTIKYGCRKGKRNRNIIDRPTGFEFYKVSILFYKLREIMEKTKN